MKKLTAGWVECSLSDMHQLFMLQKYNFFSLPASVLLIFFKSCWDVAFLSASSATPTNLHHIIN